jgi:predicted permease
MSIWERLRRLSPRGSSDPLRREIEEELRFHIEMRAQANERQGMDRRAARRAAQQSFGDVARLSGEGCEILSGAPPTRDGAAWFESLVADVRYGLRMLRRHPLTTGVAILSLGLGIGANTANFSVVYGLLHRPLPVEHSGRLVFVDAWNPNRGDGDAGVTAADLERIRQMQSFDAVGGFDDRSFTVSSGDFPERIFGASITPGLFASFGMEPQLGRFFEPADGAAYGFEEVALISDGLWVRMFAHDPEIIGRNVVLNDREVTIVGVLPPGFRFPVNHDLWLPHTPVDATNHQVRFMRLVGRLAPGATLGTVRPQLRSIAIDAAEAWPDSHRGWTLRGMPLRQGLMGGSVDQMLYIMFGAVGLVLLLACANVANLQLSRAPERQQEFMVRSAIGGSRRRLLRQLFTESIVLGLAGGALGLVVARGWLAGMMSGATEELPYWADFSLDLTTLLYTVAIAVGTAVLFGVFPAFRVAGGTPSTTLSAAGRGAIGATSKSLQAGLVVAQLALAVVLLVGATLMMRSFLDIQRADPGFDFRPLLSLRIGLSGDQYDEPQTRTAYYEQVRRELEALPEVVAAAATAAIPADDGGSDVGVVPVGGTYSDDDPLFVTVVASTTGFFDTIDVDLMRGRDFNVEESARGDRGVVVVGISLAERLWPGAAAVGQQIRSVGSGNVYDVIGVVPDLQYEEFGEDTPTARLQMHIPYAFGASRSMAILVRGTVPPAELLAPTREVLRSIDAGQAPFDMQTMTDRRAVNAAGEGFMGQSFGVFGFIALVLAVFGVYAVIAHAVARRTREMGLRIALGARPLDVTRAVVASGARLAFLGVGIGSVAAWAFTRLLSGLVFGVRAQEPGVVFLVGAVLTAAALVASLMPARRAANVDPTEALRGE